MPKTSKYLAEPAIIELRREIAEHDGAELFAVLSKSPNNELYDLVRVVCRGTTTEVPALLSRTSFGDMTVHNHPSGVLRPSEQDLYLATLFGEEGVGSMIVNNDVSECTVVVEASEAREVVDVDEVDVVNIFSPDGNLAKKYSQYEYRESQERMALRVAGTLNQGGILTVEAGTGTGKSLAYLVPALLWAKHNRGRIVIATKTIALQEQLVFKDIPLARKLVLDAPRASLVKGRGNYACLRKINDLQQNQLALFQDEESGLREEIEDLAEWALQSQSGDRADLPFVPSHEAWEAVRSDSDMCLGAKCPYFQKAPFYQSRREAAQARILVVNQALLFSDLSVRSISENYKAAAVIPAYEHVVIDEAHSIEDIASDHFAKRVSSLGLRLTMAKFLSSGRRTRGLFHRLYIAALENNPIWAKELEEDYLLPFRVLQEQVSEQVHQLSQLLHQTFNANRYKSEVVWLKEAVLQSGRLDEPRYQAGLLLESLFQILLHAKSIFKEAQAQDDAFLAATEGLQIEIEARLRRFEDSLTTLKSFAIRPEENQVPWLELRRSRQYLEFTYQVSPLDVSKALKGALFEPFSSVTLTSATLDLQDQFQFFSQRNGLGRLEEKALLFEAFPSPFDYASQAEILLTITDTSPNQTAYAEELADIVMRIHQLGPAGGTLVLFTAYRLLNQVANLLRGPLASSATELLIQGKAPRASLIKQMKINKGILLGTDSFWEGIDLPGDALTKLIMTKLPFPQIGDPLFEARCETIERNGGSSFKDYSLPLALLKFKQGAGRLIRTRTDRGLLFITDNRIHTKSYGRRFLKQVQSYPIRKCPVARLELFLEEDSSAIT